jgi:hypothetical protein
MGYAFCFGFIPLPGTVRARVKTILKTEPRTIAPVPLGHGSSFLTLHNREKPL